MDQDDTQTQGGQDFEPPPAETANGSPAPAPSPAPPPVAAAPQGPTGRRRGHIASGLGVSPQGKPTGRPRGKAGEVPDTFDASAPGAPKWSSHEAEILWPELMAWLQAKGRSPYDVMVNVIRIEPPQRAGIGEPFEAHACVGDGSNTPGAALKFMVEEFYHLRVCRTPARYELQFVWRQNGQYVAHAYLSLQSPAEIIALRNAQLERRMYAQSYGAQPPPGLGGAPHYRPQGPGPQPQQQPPQQPYGYPPPYPYFQPPQQQPQSDPAILRRLELLEEENRRLRAGQSIGVRPVHPGTGAPPTPPAAPPPQDLATALVAALKAVGFGSPAAPQQQQVDPMAAVRSGFAILREFRKFNDEAEGLFEREDDEPEARQLPILPAPPETPAEEDSPYDVTELPSQWDDGSKAKLVRDRQTGKVDLLGMALMNPRPAQKLMDAGASFMEAWSRRRGLGGPPPEEEQQQFQPPPQQFQPPPQHQLPPQESAPPAPPPPPPNPNEGGDDGWGMG